MSQFVEGIALSAIPENGGTGVDLTGQKIAFFRVGDQAYAIDDACSKKLRSRPERSTSTKRSRRSSAPKHRSLFSIVTGQVFSLPAVRPVHSYDTKMRDGVVYVAKEPRPLMERG